MLERPGLLRRPGNHTALKKPKMTKCQIVNEYLKFYGRKNVLLKNLFYDMTDCQTSTGSSTLTEAVEEQNQVFWSELSVSDYYSCW